MLPACGQYNVHKSLIVELQSFSNCVAPFGSQNPRSDADIFRKTLQTDCLHSFIGIHHKERPPTTVPLRGVQTLRVHWLCIAQMWTPMKCTIRWNGLYRGSESKTSSNENLHQAMRIVLHVNQVLEKPSDGFSGWGNNMLTSQEVPM